MFNSIIFLRQMTSDSRGHMLFRIVCMFLFAMCFSVFSSFAGASLVGEAPEDNALLAYVDLFQKKDQRSFKNIRMWSKLDAKEARSCRNTYNDLFKSGTVRILLAFGYHDNNDAVFDGRFYVRTIEALTRSCPRSSSSVCGFSLVAGSMVSSVVVLEKTIPFYRAGKRRVVKIQFTVARPSVNVRDERNFRGGAPTARQRKASQRVNDLFFSSISGVRPDGASAEKCDVCMYYGHARNGGGPDFFPVPLKRRDAEGKTIYRAYEREKKGYRDLLRSLELSKNDPPKLISIQACHSHTHFYDKPVCANNAADCVKTTLKDFTKTTGFILTTDYSWPQNFGGSVGLVLDTVLGMKCRSAWNENNNELKASFQEKKEAFGIYGGFL